jgi:hypothetical protein
MKLLHRNVELKTTYSPDLCVLCHSFSSQKKKLLGAVGSRKNLKKQHYHIK